MIWNCTLPIKLTNFIVIPYRSIAFDNVSYLSTLMKSYKIESFNAMLYHFIWAASLITTLIYILLIWTVYKVWQLMCHVIFSISYNMEQYNIV